MAFVLKDTLKNALDKKKDPFSFDGLSKDWPQSEMVSKLGTSCKSNLHSSSNTCPLVNQCKNIAEGIQ